MFSSRGKKHGCQRAKVLCWNIFHKFSQSVNIYMIVLVIIVINFAIQNFKNPDVSLIDTPEWNKEFQKFNWNICVLTMDRANSLKRLLKSLQIAKYEDINVDLSISVDVRNTSQMDEETVQVAEKFLWTHGRKMITIHKTNQGLLTQWLNA